MLHQIGRLGELNTDNGVIYSIAQPIHYGGSWSDDPYITIDIKQVTLWCTTTDSGSICSTTLTKPVYFKVDKEVMCDVFEFNRKVIELYSNTP